MFREAGFSDWQSRKSAARTEADDYGKGVTYVNGDM